jgi:hypothetical protein
MMIRFGTMRVTCWLPLLCLSLSCPAAAPETGAKKLRETIRLPTINLSFHLTFASGKGWTLDVDGVQEDASAEIVKLYAKEISAAIGQ